MVRIIAYALLGGIAALVIGLLIGAGQYVGTGASGFVIIIGIGVVIGALIASWLNNRSKV